MRQDAAGYATERCVSRFGQTPQFSLQRLYSDYSDQALQCFCRQEGVFLLRDQPLQGRYRALLAAGPQHPGRDHTPLDERVVESP